MHMRDKDASFSVHHRNIQTLAIEIYKHIHRLSPAIMGEVFKINRTLPDNLRIHNEFSSRVPKTVKYGTETISFLAPKVWALVPGIVKVCSFWKLLNLKSGNGNQIVYVGYAKLICNMLVFFKYEQMYSLIQMHIFYVYMTVIVVIFRCQTFYSYRRFSFDVASISAKNFKRTFSPTLSF